VVAEDDWAAERLAQDREVAERVAVEQALASWWTRVAAAFGTEVVLHTSTGRTYYGVVQEAGPDWCVLATGHGAVLINLGHVTVMKGVQKILTPTALTQRIGPGPAYRSIARSGALVQVTMTAGVLSGWIAEVLKDAITLRLATDAEDVVVTVPFRAVVAAATDGVDGWADTYS
jgi:hypothetical protein